VLNVESNVGEGRSNANEKGSELFHIDLTIVFNLSVPDGVRHGKLIDGFNSALVPEFLEPAVGDGRACVRHT